MRKKKIFPLLAIFLGIAVLFPGIDSLAAKPVALDTLRQEFAVQKKLVVLEKTRREVFNSYIDKLVDLENDLLLKRRGLKKVAAVRQEIRSVRKEMGASLQGEYEASPQASLFVMNPGSKPAPTRVSPSSPLVVADLEIPPLYDPVAAEAAAKKVAEEATRKAAAEAAAQKVAEEAARKAAVEAVAQKVAEEAARKAAVEAVAQKVAKEAARKAAVEAVAQKVAKEAAQKAARKDVAPRPAAKPAASNRPNKSHISNVQGQAAAADFSRHNVYEFELSRTDNVRTLTFWATGRSNIDSNGKIWLITPDGRREKVGIWEVSTVLTVGVTSYKDLPAIEHDISKLVTRPGTYKVEFEWTDGDGPLYIYRVELTP